MSAEVWGVVAAFAGVGAAFLAVFVGAFFWLVSAIQRSSQEIRAEMRELRTELRAEIRQEGQERRAEMHQEAQERRAEMHQEAQERRADLQRLIDVLYRHRHEGGGTIYVPESAD